MDEDRSVLLEFPIFLTRPLGNLLNRHVIQGINQRLTASVGGHDQGALREAVPRLALDKLDGCSAQVAVKRIQPRQSEVAVDAVMSALNPRDERVLDDTVGGEGERAVLDNDTDRHVAAPMTGTQQHSHSRDHEPQQ